VALLPQPARLFGHNSFPFLEHVEVEQFKAEFATNTNNIFRPPNRPVPRHYLFYLFLLLSIIIADNDLYLFVGPAGTKSIEEE
jgi:hypothetical protein